LPTSIPIILLFDCKNYNEFILKSNRSLSTVFDESMSDNDTVYHLDAKEWQLVAFRVQIITIEAQQSCLTSL